MPVGAGNGGVVSARRRAFAAVPAALCVVVGQAAGSLPRPMVPGGVIALNMAVVISGIPLGPAAGARWIWWDAR